MVKVRLSVPELDEPMFDDEVTMNNINEFEQTFDNMLNKYNMNQNFKMYKDRIKNDVMNDDGFYNKEYDISRNTFHSKMTNNLPKEEISKEDLKFLKQCKESNLFKKAPKEVMDFLNSLDEKPEIDPNEGISFWITYQATFLTELYSPEFFKRNPQEVLDDIDDLSIKITIPRIKLKETSNAFGLIKEEFIKAMLGTLNIDPNTLGTEFKDSFLAKTGIIYMDIIGVDLTRAMQEKYKGLDEDIDTFMTNVYKGISEDVDIITYRDVERLIK